MNTSIKDTNVMQNSVTPRKEHIQIVKEKHELCHQLMNELQIPCWIVFIRETSASRDPVQDLVIAGDVVWHSAFIFSNKEPYQKIAVVGNFDADAEKEKGIWDKVIPYKEGITKPLREVITEINPSKIALNYSIDDVMSDGLSHGMFLTLQEILSQYKNKFISAEPLVKQLRSQKTHTELALITKAAEITEQINTEITQKLQVGLTEIEIQEMFYERMNAYGVAEAWQRTNCPAVDAGPEKNFGHSGPTTNKTKKGYTLHNDFGVKYKGYCSDIQRMWFFGKEEDIPEQLQHAFNTVKTAIRTAQKAIKPGMKGFEIDNIARKIVTEHGYDEFAHALGHQVGRNAHDGGMLLAPLWERYGDLPRGIIKPNQVFTLELYVTTQNYGMVSLEEMIVVTDTGSRFIVPPQEKYIVIDRDE